GCVRMPRIIGLQAALDVILGGKLLNPNKALKAGLVDRVVHPAILMDQAKIWADEIIKEGAKKRRKKFKPKGAGVVLESFMGRPIVFSQAKKTVLKMTHGHYPAPLKAIEVISKTYGMSDREKALKIECEAF